MSECGPLKDLEGAWDCYMDERFDEFLSALGFSWLVRKAICACMYGNVVKFIDKGIYIKTVSIITREEHINYGEDTDTDILGLMFILKTFVDGNVIVSDGCNKDNKNIDL